MLDRDTTVIKLIITNYESIKVTKLLTIQAGPKAFEHIQNNGLQATDIDAVFGASGAAKWLAIYGLDRAIFSQWLTQLEQPLLLYGTSVGAFKLAAACLQDPAVSLDRLATAYTEQSYPEAEFSADKIAQETLKILATISADGGVEKILSHPYFRFNCGAVKTSNAMTINQSTRQKLALAKAFIQSFQGRKGYAKQLQRAIFHHPDSAQNLQGIDDVITHHVPLSQDNLNDALLASGSIPGLMHGIVNPAGAPAGTYFDGGMLDYHPIPKYLGISDGLVLYPHFYQHLIPGWFDKFFKSRYASAQLLDNVILASPSQQMLEQMPGGKIPDRKDFITFKDDDQQRKQNWRKVMNLSLQLGDEFLELMNSGKLAEEVKPLT